LKKKCKARLQFAKYRLNLIQFWSKYGIFGFTQNPFGLLKYGKRYSIARIDFYLSNSIKNVLEKHKCGYEMTSKTPKNASLLKTIIFSYFDL
jgi:hypothetical protein